MAFEVDEDGAVAMPLAIGPIVDAQHAGRRQAQLRQRSYTPQQRVWTHREPEFRHEPGAGFTAEGDADRGDERLQARAAPAARRDKARKAFGEDALGAGG